MNAEVYLPGRADGASLMFVLGPASDDPASSSKDGGVGELVGNRRKGIEIYNVFKSKKKKIPLYP